jgi:hypothetical protein
MDRIAAIGLVIGCRVAPTEGNSLSDYLCHLRRRNGTETELDIHNREPPRVGTAVEVVIADKEGPARVVCSTRHAAEPIVNVYLDEID